GFRRAPGWKCGIARRSKAGWGVVQRSWCTARAARSGLNIELRRGGGDDLALIAQIQAASPEASQSDVPEYLKYDFLVAVCDGRVAGFAVARRLAEGESEL